LILNGHTEQLYTASLLLINQSMSNSFVARSH